MPRTAIKVPNPATGSDMEVFSTVAGVLIPSVYARAFDDAGVPVDLRATNAGALRTNLENALLSVEQTKSGSAVVNTVASSTSVVTIAPSLGARKALVVFNDSTSSVFVKYGSGATSTSFTVKIPAAGLWEMPLPIFTGQVTAIWVSADGAARVTELS